jgi:hypothetical protein
LLATGALAGLEGGSGDPVDAPGWTALLELLQAIEWAAQVALMLWAPVPYEVVA